MNCSRIAKEGNKDEWKKKLTGQTGKTAKAIHNQVLFTRHAHLMKRDIQGEKILTEEDIATKQ